MWGLLSWRKQVLIVTALALALAWAADACAEWYDGERASLLKLISFFAFVMTVGVAGIASLTWRHIWQWFPLIARKTFPDLNGTWEGTMVSTWVDPATGKPLPDIPTTLWIRQNLFSMSIKLRTKESTSYSTRCVLEAEHDAGRFRIWYSYDNQPKAEVAYRSSQHEGVAWLEMDIDDDDNRLAGQYYSSRRTAGDMTYTRVRQQRRRGRAAI